MVVGQLVALAMKVLAHKHRLHGRYRAVLLGIAISITVLGIFIGLQGLDAMLSK